MGWGVTVCVLMMLEGAGVRALQGNVTECLPRKGTRPPTHFAPITTRNPAVRGQGCCSFLKDADIGSEKSSDLLNATQQESS